jgi:hypothetical protein
MTASLDGHSGVHPSRPTTADEADGSRKVAKLSSSLAVIIVSEQINCDKTWPMKPATHDHEKADNERA